MDGRLMKNGSRNVFFTNHGTLVKTSQSPRKVPKIASCHPSTIHRSLDTSRAARSKWLARLSVD